MIWIVALSAFAVYANAAVFLAGWGLKWSVLFVNWTKNGTLLPQENSPDGNCRGMVARPIYFSVHLPTHNEPPDIVIKTIDSILASEYAHFELLVIDNNTDETDLWLPVYEYCLDKGPHIRFYHCINVKNAKAGALDIALELRSREATHVVIVDADYTVHKDFLSRAAALLSENQCDYLQFPQSYRGEGAEGLKNELGLYFSTVSQAADAANTMLLTGTLSVIRAEALDAVGGWNTTTLTEDAEIGLQLHMRGFRGRYISQAAGAGLLPFTFADLEKQRERWINGNFQVLTRYFKRIITVKKSYLLAVLCQLSAWFAYLLVPVVFLLLFPLTTLSGTLSEPAAPGLVIAAATIILDFLCRFVFISLSGVGSTILSVCEAFMVSWSLAGRSSLATFTGNFPSARIFHRTNKSLVDRVSVSMDSRTTQMFALFGILIMVQGFYLGFWWLILAGALLVLMLPFQKLTSRQLRIYRDQFLAG